MKNDEDDLSLNKTRGPARISISSFVKIPSIPIGILGIWASDGIRFGHQNDIHIINISQLFHLKSPEIRDFQVILGGIMVEY